MSHSKSLSQKGCSHQTPKSSFCVPINGTRLPSFHNCFCQSRLPFPTSSSPTMQKLQPAKSLLHRELPPKSPCHQPLKKSNSERIVQVEHQIPEPPPTRSSSKRDSPKASASTSNGPRLDTAVSDMSNLDEVSRFSILEISAYWAFTNTYCLLTAQIKDLRPGHRWKGCGACSTQSQHKPQTRFGAQQNLSRHHLTTCRLGDSNGWVGLQICFLGCI